MVYTDLEYKDFENNLVDSFEIYGGRVWRFKFSNNYGASIIKHRGSYGNEDDLFELAVIKYENENDNIGTLCYETPITDDVIGWLTNKEVLEYLNKIKELA